MKGLTKKIEEIFEEIAFAEERETGYGKRASERLTGWIDSVFTAITFAEAGEFETAKYFTGGGSGAHGKTGEYCLSGFCTGRA